MHHSGTHSNLDSIVLHYLSTIHMAIYLLVVQPIMKNIVLLVKTEFHIKMKHGYSQNYCMS